MANNYTLFSAALTLAKAGSKRRVAQDAWIVDAMVSVADREDDSEQSDTEWVVDRLNALGGFNIDVSSPPELEHWPQFQGSADASEDYLWIHSDEGGDLEHVALFVGAFLRKFKVKKAFTLTWADTCSSPRIGEFGGGSLYVTADEEVWLSTDRALSLIEDGWRPSSRRPKPKIQPATIAARPKKRAKRR